MPAACHFLILLHVNPRIRKPAPHGKLISKSPKKFTFRNRAQTALLLICTVFLAAGPLEAADPLQREAFSKAWRAAATGERDIFEQLMPGLKDYLLFPYLQYEDLRHRRASVDSKHMASFLAAHQDWAFAAGLKTAWLITLGSRRRWDALIDYAPGSKDTRVQCYLANARIERDETDGLVAVAQSLWAVGKSQPDACDPVFKWLKSQGGITSGLAWERIGRSMDERQPRLTLYLARYLDEDKRLWADRWYQQDRGGYRQLKQARQWQDTQEARDITRYGLKRLARNDSDRAWQAFQSLEAHFSWPPDVRAGIVREIALWSAVEGVDETPLRMQAVPAEYLDGQLLEWWARYDLAKENWAGVILTVGRMQPEQGNDSRWRYWEARASLEAGDRAHAGKQLEALALEANYYGFLSADRLDLPYTICAQQPEVEPAGVEGLRRQAGMQRALELRKAGLKNWSRSEWKMVVRTLDKDGLRIAAALANQEDWPDMAIMALGNSGDMRWYSWRFPTQFRPMVDAKAGGLNLDPSWVMGLMRSESAMAEDALSSAGARGLMQVMPKTAEQLAKRHALTYMGRQQLMQAEDNIQFGTTYLRELLDQFDENPVLVSGAYNAGPNAVKRWMDQRSTNDPAIWVETLPYYETRDYIPRVLAFTTIYDWRLQQPVTRISSRMPEFDSGPVSGNMQVRETAEVVCRTPG